MAEKIKGITLEIGANVAGVKKALRDVDKEIKSTSSELKQVDRLLKLDPKNTELLAQKQELLSKEISTTSGKLEAMKKAKADLDEKMKNGTKVSEEQYRYLQREIIYTEQQLGKLEKQAEQTADALSMKDSGAKTEEMTKGLEGLGGTLGNISTKAVGVAGAVTAATTAVVSAGKAVVSVSDECTSALNGFAAKAGIASEEAEKYDGVMKSIYKGNYGESISDIAEAMGTVAQNTDNIDPSNIEELTTDALALRDTFGFDINETIRAVNMMMNQFGLSGKEAFNLIAQGAQNGLDKNGDLLDSINEYSVHFKQLGLSAEEMFNSLANGTEAGTFSVDKLGDAVKEFGIRAKDNSSGTRDAFVSLGLNADEITKKFADGGETGKQAFTEVTEALFNMDDKVKQNEAGVALFGTMWEDLGVEGVKAITDLNGGITTTKEAMNEINKTKYDNITQKLGALKRAFEVDVAEPLGKKLIPTIESVTDTLTVAMPVIGKVTSFVGKCASACLKLVSAANPITGILTNITKEAVENVKAEREAQKAIDDKKQSLDAVISSYEEYRDRQAETAAQGLNELSSTQKMANELLSLADANGKVDEANRGRAQFILNELNKALGTEYSMTENVINAYGELKNSINNLIEAKKYEILMQEAEANYTESIQKQTEALKKATEAYFDYLNAPSEQKDEYKKIYNEAQAYYENLLSYQETYEEASRIATQDGTTAAINYLNQRKEAYALAASGAEDYASSADEALARAGEAYTQSLISLKQALDVYNKSGSESAKATVEAAVKEVQGSKEQFEAAGGECGSAFIKNLSGDTADITNLAKSISSALKDAVESGLSVDKGFSAGISDITKYAAKVKKETEESMHELLKSVQSDAGRVKSIPETEWKFETVKPIGRNFSAGLAAGIKDGRSEVINAAADVSSGAVLGAKRTLKIKSPSRVMRDEVGKYISLGVAEGIEENGDEVVKSFKSVLEKLDYQKEFGLISEDEYYTGLEKLRDKYFKVGTKEWLEYTQKIYNYQEKQLEDTKKAYKETYDDIYKYASDKIDAVIKKQQDYSKKLNSYGSMFKNVTISLDEGDITYYSLKDFKKETEDIEHYNTMLKNLRSELLTSGIDESAADSFFSEINSMSIDEGIKALEALSRVNAEELGEYINAYAEKFQLSEKLSSDMYGSDMKEAIDESREYMAKKLSEAGFIGQLQSSLDKIADVFADGGADSAEAFGTNFLNKIQAILQEAANSIQSFSAVADISGSLATSGGTSISNTNNSKSISISIKNTGNTSTAYQQRIETEKMLDKLAMQGVL